jgi:hypothetical protein
MKHFTTSTTSDYSEVIVALVVAGDSLFVLGLAAQLAGDLLQILS